MAEWKDMEMAKKTFETLCRALEKNDWHYRKDEENLSIECGARGEDLPMELDIRVEPELMLVVLMSHLPFRIPEDKRLEAAIAVSAVNDRLVDGNFDYNVATGKLLFRMTNSFIESQLGEEVFSYMLYCSCATIDDYNDKFLMLAKGLISLEQFLDTDKK